MIDLSLKPGLSEYDVMRLQSLFKSSASTSLLTSLPNGKIGASLLMSDVGRSPGSLLDDP